MAKFLTFFPIDSISDDNVYLGLSADSVDGRVISTLDQNIVYRIELSNQKQIQSWTSEQKLSHKVVYDFKSKKYVGIFGNQRLGCWGEETARIQKGKIKLPKSLKEIVSFDGKHTILVYTDGTCESLENRVKGHQANCKRIVDTQTQEIINIACFNTTDNHVMLTYFVRNRKGTGTIELVYFLLNDDNLTPTKLANDIPRVKRIEIAREGTSLAAFTVVEGEEMPSVMTIWSDKRIFMLPLSCEENAPTEFGPFKNLFNDLRVDRPLNIASVSTNCVAIYGGNPKQDGASLILYNTNHHIVQSPQHFKVHLDNCRLWTIGKYILMAENRRLLCARFRISEEKLCELIGSKRSTDWNRKVNNECFNEESCLEDGTKFNENAGNATVQANHKLKAPYFQSDNNLQPEIFQNFAANLGSMYNFDADIDVVQGDSAQDSPKVRSVVHPEDRLYSYPEIMSLVEELVINGACEIEITERVIPLLIKSNLPNELAVCLRQYTNVSERMLAKCLKYFIGMDESEAKLAYINQIFSCSFSDELIKEHLRTNLNLDNAIYLLDIIHRDLVDDELSLEESPQYGHNFDSDRVLLNWFTVILEAHYQQFLLSRDSNVNDFILKWKELIESFVSGIRDLKPVKARLVNLVNGKMKENDNTSSKWYSVETVRLY